MYIQLDELNMYYHDNQKTNLTPIVFIHGLGENLDSWKDQLDTFDSKYRIIAMDLRGHNRSDDGNKPISIQQFAEDIIALCDKLAIKQAHFVGLSMGGIIAQYLAINHAKYMLSASLCNTASYVTEEAKHKLPERLAMIETILMDEMADFIARACLPEPTNPEIYQTAFNIFRLNRKKPYSDATKATFSIDYRNQLKSITIPTLIFTGECDKATPPSASEFIHSQIPHSILKIIPKVGHLSKLENPTMFNQLILDFIKDIA